MTGLLIVALTRMGDEQFVSSPAVGVDVVRFIKLFQFRIPLRKVILRSGCCCLSSSRSNIILTTRYRFLWLVSICLFVEGNGLMHTWISKRTRALNDENMVMLWLHMYCPHWVDMSKRSLPNDRVRNQPVSALLPPWRRMVQKNKEQEQEQQQGEKQCNKNNREVNVVSEDDSSW